MSKGCLMPSDEATKLVSSTRSRLRRTALRIVKSNVLWMTKDDVMIAVPMSSPATTIATWVLRRKKLPSPIRRGKRFRPAHTRTARQVPTTTAMRIWLVSIGSSGRGVDGFHDRAIPHQDHPLRLVSHCGVVGHDDEREALLAVQPFHQGHDLLRGLRVEVASRLVREHDVRLVHEGPGDGDSLLLSAAELRGLLHRDVAEADGLESRNGPLSGRLWIDASHEEGQLDVFRAPKDREEVVVLEDETHPRRAEVRLRVVAEGRESLARDPDLARGEVVDPR